MKKLFFMAINIFILLIVFGTAYAEIKPLNFPKQLGTSDNYVCVSGESIFIVDARTSAIEDASTFSLQFGSGVTCKYVRPSSGATVGVFATTINNLPDSFTRSDLNTNWTSGISDVYKWTMAIPYTDVMTGDTYYQYPFQLDPGAYVMVKIDNSGTTDVLVPLTLAASKGPWGKSRPFVISEGTFTMPNGGTGVSEFTSSSIGSLPTGTKYVDFLISSGTSAYYTTNGDTPTATGDSFYLYLATKDGFPVNQAEDMKWIAGVGGDTIRYRALSRNPEE